MAATSANRSRFRSASSFSIASRSSLLRRPTARGLYFSIGFVGSPFPGVVAAGVLAGGPMLPEGVRFFRVCRRCTGARVDGVPTAVDGWGVDAADPVGVFDAASLVVCRGAVPSPPPPPPPPPPPRPATAAAAAPRRTDLGGMIAQRIWARTRCVLQRRERTEESVH